MIRDDKTAPDLSALASLPGLDVLRLHARWLEPEVVSKLSTGEIRGLAALRLKRLYVEWKVSREQIESISTLSELQDLELGMEFLEKNQVPGEYLGALGRLPSLRRLRLSGFKFSDASMRAFESLRRLEELDVGDNHGITDAGVANLARLPNLRFLSIGRLGVAGLAALKSFPRLENLTLGTFEPTVAKADLSVLCNLKRLDFGGFAEEGGKTALPSNLRQLKVDIDRVDELDLQHCKSIESVDLRIFRNRLEGDDAAKRIIARWLIALPELRDLTLHDPTEAEVAAIAGLTSLRGLSLEASCMPSIADGGMRRLSALQNLESLCVQDDYGGGNKTFEVNAGMDVLPKLKQLRRLELRGLPAVTRDALANVWQMKRLRTLKLNLVGKADGSIDDMLARIGTLGELEDLSLSFVVRKTATDEGLKNLASLKRLRCLDLGDIGGYSDDALASLVSALPTLQVLKRTYKPGR
jgi:hypothetical protein